MYAVYEDEGEEQGEGEEEELDRPEPPREYKEGKLFQCCLRCTGGGCWIVLGLCAVAWVTHSISIEGTSSISDAPPFSKTLIWRSLAHHTDEWAEWQRSVSPPPPGFV